MPKKKAIADVGPAPRSVDIDSDDDDDYYSNILDRKRKEAVTKKKKAPKKVEMAPLDDSLSKDYSFSDDYSEEEMTLAEKIKQNVDERNKKEKIDEEKEMEAIRLKALQLYGTQCTSNAYVNPDVDEIKKKLRYIHEVESKLDESPTARLNLRRSFNKERFHVAEKVHLTVTDLEYTANPRLTYEWPMDEPFERLVDTIAKIWEVESSCVLLEYSGFLHEEATKAKRVCRGHTPRNFGLQPHEYVRLTAMIIGGAIPRSLHSVKGDLSIVELKCQTEDGHRSKKLSVKKDASFADIKETIKDILRITSISKLIFDAEQVADTDTPHGLDMEDGSMVDVYQ